MFNLLKPTGYMHQEI